MLEEAIKLATFCHKWEKRKTWEDYISHPLAVMGILKKYDFPDEVLIAAVLHDVCEDTDMSNIEIRSLFWDRVWFIINALTKNQKPKNNKELIEAYNNQKKSNWKYETIEEYMDYRFHLYINRFSVWIIAEPWIMFVKIADQIDNSRSLSIFPKEKADRKIKELEEYFIPVYEKMSYLITPMYIDKYKWLLGDLKNEIKKYK